MARLLRACRYRESERVKQGSLGAITWHEDCPPSLRESPSRFACRCGAVREANDSQEWTTGRHWGLWRHFSACFPGCSALNMDSAHMWSPSSRSMIARRAKTSDRVRCKCATRRDAARVRGTHRTALSSLGCRETRLGRCRGDRREVSGRGLNHDRRGPTEPEREIKWQVVCPTSTVSNFWHLGGRSWTLVHWRPAPAPESHAGRGALWVAGRP